MSTADNFPLLSEQQVPWGSLDLRARGWVPEWWVVMTLLQGRRCLLLHHCWQHSHQSDTILRPTLGLFHFLPLRVVSMESSCPLSPNSHQIQDRCHWQRPRMESVPFLARVTRKHVQGLHSVEWKGTWKNRTGWKPRRRGRDELWVSFFFFWNKNRLFLPLGHSSSRIEHLANC